MPSMSVSPTEIQRMIKQSIEPYKQTLEDIKKLLEDEVIESREFRSKATLILSKMYENDKRNMPIFDGLDIYLGEEWGLMGYENKGSPN